MDKRADKPLPATSQAHDALDGELQPWLRGAEPPPAELDSLFQQLEQGMTAERGPRAWLRARSTAVRSSLAWAAVGLVAIATAAAFRRPDMVVYPAARMAAVLVVIAAGVALSLSLSLRPLHRPAVPVRVAATGIATALVGVLALYVLPPAHVAHPASLHAPGWPELLTRAIPCLAIGLAIGALVFAVLALLDRGGTRRAPVMAVAAGLAANLALQLHCPVTAPSHMVAGHFGVALLLVAGALLFPPRRRDR